MRKQAREELKVLHMVYVCVHVFQCIRLPSGQQAASSETADSWHRKPGSHSSTINQTGRLSVGFPFLSFTVSKSGSYVEIAVLPIYSANKYKTRAAEATFFGEVERALGGSKAKPVEW